MEEAKARADNEQLTLSKSWGAAVFVFATWDALLLLLVAWACRCRTMYQCQTVNATGYAPAACMLCFGQAVCVARLLWTVPKGMMRALQAVGQQVLVATLVDTRPGCWRCSGDWRGRLDGAHAACRAARRPRHARHGCSGRSRGGDAT